MFYAYANALKHNAFFGTYMKQVVRQWEQGSKEHVALLVKARKTELEAQARIAAGEEAHVELSAREMGADALVVQSDSAPLQWL